jgi:hypothetical protein
MATKQISPEEVQNVIESAGNKFFTVMFVKRTDNTLRTMNCRKGVKTGVKGTGHRSHKSGLVTIYDMTNKGFRNINLSGVRSISANGTKYVVKT